jgi:amino acid adenylation domain-containing protein
MKLSDIHISSVAEDNDLAGLYEGINNTWTDWPENKSITDLFREMVIAYPDKPALKMENTTLTYRELEMRSNQVANWLICRHVKKETVVAIYMDRSINLVVSILGILKAGGAYLPLNTDYPFDRLKYILRETKANVLISEVNYLREINQLQWYSNDLHSVLCIDSKDFYKETEARNELMRKELWEYLGAQATDDIAGGGWMSSYTGEKFSREEMDEYADNAVNKLLPYLDKNKRVLEIGCASGITMYRVAPLVKEFYGTDLSQPIIDYNRQICKEKGFDNIRLRCIEAEDISLLEERDFDVIIINSVVQAFSGFNYLRKIIGYALELLGENGILFLGDIMDLDKKDELVKDVHAYKKANPYAAAKLDFSNEMFVPRAFFDDLKAELPCLKSVHHADKTGTIKNELSQFRYDVVLEIDKTYTAKEPVKKIKYQFDGRVLDEFSDDPCGVNVSPDQLSHIIFTSGSTGNPKGVMVEHRSLIKTVKNTNYIDITPEDVVLQGCEISFDPSCLEIFGSLLNGATLCLISKKKLFNTSSLYSYLIKNDVTIVQFVASLFHLHVDSNPGIFSGVRLLMLGGEVLSPAHIRKVKKACPNLTILNCYGPTENTINTTTFEIDDEYDIIPIGKPVSNTGVYILNKQLKMQPPGVSGELFIYGDGLTRGYVNDEQLTKEKFIDDPFRPGERMYRTGDLVRMRQDGNIEFLGRVDEQVKIKGHRVELKEIEKTFYGIPPVKQAVVMLSAQGILTAYITLHEDIETDMLKQLLAIDLPFYMIPQYIVKLEQFPLNVHGKVDRNALPDPETILKQAKDTYVPPGNLMESKLIEIFQLVLGKDRIGIKDDFFELGGHSLLATKALTLIHKELNAKIRLEDIFENPRIEKLALVIGQAEREAYRDIMPLPPQEYYDVSYAQRRLWVMDQVEQLKLAYNMTDAYTFEGVVDETIFRQALQFIVNRHESLRTTFTMVDGKPVQKIADTGTADLYTADLRNETDPDAKARELVDAEAVTPFDLEEGPLLKCMLLRVADNRYVFLQKMHHIISDGWSMELLVKEVSAFYNAAKKGTEPKLLPLKIQYKEFAAWQNKLLQDDHLNTLRSFWKEQFSEKPVPLHLPLDFERPAVKKSNGEKIMFSFDKLVRQKIADISNKQGATMYMTLVALLNSFIYKLTGQRDIVIGSPVAGRQHANLHGQIGLYLNTLALRTKLEDQGSFSAYLDTVKKTTLAAIDHQLYPLDLLTDDLKIDRDISRSTLFDIGFTWQNVESSAGESGPGHFEGFDVLPFSFNHQKVKTDLWFHAWEQDDQVQLSVTYDTALFKRSTMQNFIEDFKTLTSAILESSNSSIQLVIANMVEEEADRKRKDKKKSSLESFLKIQKSPAPRVPASLVKTAVLNREQGFPMIIEPAMDGVLLTEWLKDNEVVIAEYLRKSGAVLLRGFNINTVEAFEQVSGVLGEEQMKYMDQSSPRSLVAEKIYTSTDYPADQQINMHNELSYSQDWPMRILFYCLKPPATQGETPIADSRRVLQYITEKTKARFAEKGILYVRNLVDGLGLSWRDVYQTTDKQVAEDYCKRHNISYTWLGDNHFRISWKKPAIYTHPYTGEEVWFNHGFFFNAWNLPEEVRMAIADPAQYPSDTFYGDGTPIEKEVIAELREAFEKAKVVFPWEKGDVLLLDNMLMSHGRSSFTGVRKILVSMNTGYSTTQKASS